MAIGSRCKEAARWWAALPTDSHSEESFIRDTAPAMRVRLTQEAVRDMDLAAFREAFRHVNAFRAHARQVNNAHSGLPPGHRESLEDRVDRLCDGLWTQTTPAGKTVRDAVEFVLWGTTPSDMEQRLWLATTDEKYRFAHLGKSALGEAVGWARPDDYPPRNNRTNKALRALGHDVKLFTAKQALKSR